MNLEFWFYPNIFLTYSCRPLIFQTKKLVLYNHQSLKYLMFSLSGCKIIGIRGIWGFLLILSFFHSVTFFFKTMFLGYTRIQLYSVCLWTNRFRLVFYVLKITLYYISRLYFFKHFLTKNLSKMIIMVVFSSV